MFWHWITHLALLRMTLGQLLEICFAFMLLHFMLPLGYKYSQLSRNTNICNVLALLNDECSSGGFGTTVKSGFDLNQNHLKSQLKFKTKQNENKLLLTM